MISAAPLDRPLTDEYYGRAYEEMRRANVSYFAVDRCWQVLRDYPPSSFRDVLQDLKLGKETAKWFGGNR